MAETKALSPEIKGLLETVRNQAKEYAEAFEVLAYEKEDADKLRSELKNNIVKFSNFFDNLKAKIDTERKSFDEYVEKIVIRLETDVLKTEKKYEELSDIGKLKNDIENIYKEISSELAKLKSVSDEFKSLVIFEIDNAINKFKISFDSKIIDESSKLEKSLLKVINNLDAHLITFERNQQFVKDQIDNEISSVAHEIESADRYARSMIKSINNNVDILQHETKNFDRDIKQLFDAQSQGPNSKNNSKDNEIEDKLKDYLSIEEFSKDTNKTRSEFENQIISLSNLIEDLSSTAEKNRMKMNLSIFISVCSIFGLIILFFLSLYN